MLAHYKFLGGDDYDGKFATAKFLEGSNLLDESISDYINTAQATGAFAAVFYFPLLLLWDSVMHKSDDGNFMQSKQFQSLLLFTISF